MIKKGVVTSGKVVFIYSQPPEEALIGLVEDVEYPIAYIRVIPRSGVKNKFGNFQKIDISKRIALTIMTDARIYKYMTPKEKNENPNWETIEGYLKTLDFKEACKIWWKDHPKKHERFLSLPGFDAEIFKEITGIAVETDVNVTATKTEKDIEIEKLKEQLKESKSTGENK